MANILTELLSYIIIPAMIVGGAYIGKWLYNK